MKRLFLAFLLKYNGALAGMCVFAVVVGASFHIMHGKFDQQAQCQAALQTQILERSQQAIAKPSTSISKQVDCSNSRQMESFSFYQLFFSRNNS